MNDSVRVAVVGAGTFGQQHIDVLGGLGDAEVTYVVDNDAARATSAASSLAHARVGRDLDEVLESDEVDAVILATPTPEHADQAIRALRHGKAVLVEIPMADSWQKAQEVVRVQEQTGTPCMVGHVRRWNHPHRWINTRIRSRNLRHQHLVAETFFLRRTNTDINGRPRAWTDNLLWHHAAHTVDLFLHQTGEPLVDAHAVQGPIDPEIGIPLDVSIQLRSRSGAVCSLALSFNHAGPQGTWFRYVCDNGTYLAHYDDLTDGDGVAVEPGRATSGLRLQDEEFIGAVKEGRTPAVSAADVLATYRTLGQLAQSLGSEHG